MFSSTAASLCCRCAPHQFVPPHPPPPSTRSYPLLNFAAVSALYVVISHRLFLTTNSLKEAVVRAALLLAVVLRVHPWCSSGFVQPWCSSGFVPPWCSVGACLAQSSSSPCAPEANRPRVPPLPNVNQVPHDDNRLLLRNGLMMGVVAALAGCFGLLAVEARRLLL